MTRFAKRTMPASLMPWITRPTKSDRIPTHVAETMLPVKNIIFANKWTVFLVRGTKGSGNGREGSGQADSIQSSYPDRQVDAKHDEKDSGLTSEWFYYLCILERSQSSAAANALVWTAFFHGWVILDCLVYNGKGVNSAASAQMSAVSSCQGHIFCISGRKLYDIWFQDGCRQNEILDKDMAESSNEHIFTVAM